MCDGDEKVMTGKLIFEKGERESREIENQWRPRKKVELFNYIENYVKENDFFFVKAEII